MANNGKNLEYLVQLIEKSISPDSIVEHNVKLPILNSPKRRTTQCDIVIRTGKKPRETITIVEVQDRTNRVKSNDFRGWQRKLTEVGAQHLICVSRHEFPNSIKEQAASSGNIIRLITLKELSAEQIPLNFFKPKFTHRYFNITTFHYINLGISKTDLIKGYKPPTRLLNHNQKFFSVDKVELVSILNLCSTYFKPKEKQTKGRDRLKFDYKENPIYYSHNGIFIKAELDLEFEWMNETIEIPIVTISYEQNNYGTLAWVLEAAYQSPQGFVSFKMPTIYNGETYEIKDILFTNLPNGIEFDVTIKKENN